MQITITLDVNPGNVKAVNAFLVEAANQVTSLVTETVKPEVKPETKPTKKARAKETEAAAPVVEELPFTESVPATKFPPETEEIKLKTDVLLTNGKEAIFLVAGIDTVNRMQKLVADGWTVKEDKPEAPKAEAGAQSITKTDLRAVALKLSKAGKSDELAKIFSEFGASNLSGLKEADYPAVMERLVAVNA